MLDVWLRVMDHHRKHRPAVQSRLRPIAAGPSPIHHPARQTIGRRHSRPPATVNAGPPSGPSAGEPVATVGAAPHIARMMRLAAFPIVMIAVGMLAGSCATPLKKLSRAARAACAAKGGYESRSAFGRPICQIRYADGGKVCVGKADCQGSCLLNADGDAPLPKTGQAATGVCQARQYNPGCFATIEARKVTAEGARCED